jgi:hypothetical protein
MRAVGELRALALLGLLEVVERGVVHAEGKPQFGGGQSHGAAEAVGRHSNHGEVSRVDLDLAAQDVRVASHLLPQAVAEDGDRSLAARRFLVGGESPAQMQTHAQGLEVVRGDGVAEHPPRGLAFGQPDHGEVVGHHVLERVVAAADIEVVGVGERAVRIRSAFVLVEQTHDALGGDARDGPQQDHVHQREDRAVDPDAEGQNRHRDPGEAEVLLQATQAQHHIGLETHRRFSSV